MSKTRNAFAQRKLYENLLSVVGEEYLPSYSERADCNGLNKMEYWDNGDGRFEIRLRSYLDRDYPSFTGYETGLVEEELEQCQRRQKVLAIEHAKIRRHLKILYEYERSIFEEALSQGLNEKLKEKGSRTKDLISKYEWLKQLFFDYEGMLMKDEKTLEKSFQSEFFQGVGKRLRQVRKQKGITIEEIAGQVGLTRIAFGRYEMGQRDMSTLTLYRIATILDISTDWLLGVKK